MSTSNGTGTAPYLEMDMGDHILKYGRAQQIEKAPTHPHPHICVLFWFQYNDIK